IKFARSKWFPYLWWGYSAALFLGLFIATKFNIPLAFRSIILVAFFMTAVSEIIDILITWADHIRRGSIRLMRLFSYEEAKSPSERREMLKEQLPEVPKHGISRTGFLMRSGILMASLPIFPLSWGLISGAYDYWVRRQELVLSNL